MSNATTTDPQAIFYYYNPTLAGAVAFAALFLFVTIYLTIQLFRHRAWFTLPLVIGGFFEVTGYVARTLNHNHTQRLGPYIVSSIVTLVAPALFAATIYMILGRIIRLLEAIHLSPVRVTLLTKIFVLADIFSFAVQSVGAQNLTNKDPDKQHVGRILIIAALFLQIAIFGLFVIVAGVFNLRIRKQPTQVADSSLPWQRHLAAIYAASGLILLRNVVRTIEYILGTSGYINTHEAFLYACDAGPMFAVLVVMAVIYAPSLMRESKNGGQDMELQRLESGNESGNDAASNNGLT